MKKYIVACLCIAYGGLAVAKTVPQLSLWEKISWYDTDKNRYLKSALAKGDKEEAIEAIKAGADVNAVISKLTGTTPAQAAIKNKWPDVVQLLIEYGVDVHAPVKNWPWGETSLLHEAVVRELPDVVDLLLSKGINVNVKDSKGRTALMSAKDAKMMAFLLARGAQVDARSLNGEQPIHIARTIPQIKLLLQYGADINARSEVEMTPLHIAVMQNAFDLVLYLLEQGADITAQSELGATPAMVAAVFGHEDIHSYLKQKEKDH